MIGGLLLGGALLLASPPNHVMDQVDVIPPATELDLDRRLAKFEDDYNIEIVVATFDTLGGRQLQATSTQKSREWAVGSRTSNRAVFISFWRDDRRVWVEPTAMLRQVSDAQVVEVIDSKMIPWFKTGQYGRGLEEGTTALMTYLAANPYAPETRRRSRSTFAKIAGGLGTFGVVALLVLFRIMLGAAGFGGYGYRRGWGYRRSRWGGSSWGSSSSSWGGGGGFSGGGGGGGFTGRGGGGSW